MARPLSPNGRSLFAANEGSLVADGETADGSDRIRILRYEDRGRGGFKPVEEYLLPGGAWAGRGGDRRSLRG